MTTPNTALRFLLASLLVFGGLGLHELVQAQARAPLIVDGTPGASIPFVPWTIWIYLSFFPLIGWTVLSVDARRFWQLITSAIIAAGVAWSIVLIFPISFQRPEPAAIPGEAYARIFAMIHAVDSSHVSFPSLHVAVTWLCYFVLRKRKGRGLRLMLCIAISLSTLTTGQHLPIDVAGGVALAATSTFLAARLRVTPAREFIHSENRANATSRRH